MHDKNCVICDEAVTNPICLNCVERHIFAWLTEKKPTLIPLVKEIGDSLRGFSHEATFCFRCHRNLNVCPHCYAYEVLSWLEDEYPELSEEFLYLFNYELTFRIH